MENFNLRFDKLSTQQVVTLCFHATFAVARCSSSLKNISDVIFAGYDSGIRPVCGEANQVNVTLDIALRQVIDVVCCQN